MLRRNICTKTGLVNGSLGTVKNVSRCFIMVKFDHLSKPVQLLKHCCKTENFTSKESALDKKKKMRNMERRICAVIEKKFTENAALNFLSESESFSGYQRKWIAQSFEQVETPKPKKHHISDSFVNEYKDIVSEKLRQWLLIRR